jgi:hypothetical protein
MKTAFPMSIINGYRSVGVVYCFLDVKAKLKIEDVGFQLEF